MKLEVWVGSTLSSFLPRKSWDSIVFVDPCNSLISVNPQGHSKFILVCYLGSLYQAFLDMDGFGMILKNLTLPAPHSLCLGKAGPLRWEAESWIGRLGWFVEVLTSFFQDEVSVTFCLLSLRDVTTYIVPSSGQWFHPQVIFEDKPKCFSLFYMQRTLDREEPMTEFSWSKADRCLHMCSSSISRFLRQITYGCS